MYFFDQGEGTNIITQSLSGKSYTLSPFLKKGVLQAVQYWSDILSSGLKNIAPAQIFVKGDGAANASAAQKNFVDDVQTSKDLWTQSLQQGLTLSNLDPITGNYTGMIGYGSVVIGQYLGADRATGTEYGWMYDTDSILPTNDMSVDLQAVFRHELGHAFGILASADDSSKEKDEAGNHIYTFDKETLNSWTRHLVDQNGNPAKPGMTILTSEDFRQRQAKDSTLKATDYFIIDNTSDEDTTPKANISTAGKAYFKGSHVSEVLAGATFDGVDGMPVNGWEDYEPEISHITTCTLMSHSNYRTALIFTEAELAILQDMGYVFDRKKYYGYSLYRDHVTMTNRNGYSERNAAGTAYESNVYSTVPLGVGFHLYGSNNTVTQAADILTRGNGAVGIRVEGTDNSLTLAPQNVVHADGYRGMGVLISYGRNHILNQYGTITALGTGGNGVQFDFGSNACGALDYRGSYIRYVAIPSNGKLISAENRSFDYHDGYTLLATPELDGPLVSAYNLQGSVSGNAHAIYISKNAFVKDINVLPGASINGAITSDWKKFTAEGGYAGAMGDGSDALKIRYKGSLYAYDKYIPNLVTQLNFCTNIAYNGDITGDDNMKINVDSGTLAYSGTANVASVQVASGVVLAGGTYTVNDMTAKMAAGFADSTTGQLINHGTIQPAAADMRIHGRLVSDGSLGLVSADGQQSRQIVVDGGAAVQGSKLVRTDGSSYLPDKSYTFLNASGGITGSLTNTAGSAFSGLLNLKSLVVSGTSGAVTLGLGNNIGSLNPDQQWGYDNLSTLLANTQGDSAKQAQLGLLLGASTEAAGAGLTSAARTGSPDGAALTMSSLTAMNAIWARTMYLSTTGMTAGSSVSPARSDGDVTKESSIIPIDLGPTTSGWLKFSKSWESIGNSDTNGHGFATSFGFDHSIGNSWRLGEFVSYGDNSFAGTNSILKNKDYRLGIYGIREKGPSQIFLYFDAGRQNNDSKRYISAGASYMAESSYKSNTIELGGRYTYDTDYGKAQSWHRKPYGEIHVVHYNQDGYDETGAGVWNQSVGSGSSTYSAATVGFGLEKRMKNEEIEVHVGYKRVLSGSDPTYPVHWMDGGAEHIARGSGLDKNLLVVGVHAEQKQDDNWNLSGDIELEQGHSQQNIQASVMLKKIW